MIGIPKDFVLLNCTQDSKLDASSNQKLLACIQILWLLFSLKYSKPSPTRSKQSFNLEKFSSRPKICSQGTFLFQEQHEAAVTHMSLCYLAPGEAHQGSFSLRQIDCFIELLLGGRRRKLFTIHLQDKNTHSQENLKKTSTVISSTHSLSCLSVLINHKRFQRAPQCSSQTKQYLFPAFWCVLHPKHWPKVSRQQGCTSSQAIRNASTQEQRLIPGISRNWIKP